MSRNDAVAEEITQEVFLALLTQIDRFDAERGELSTWLCGIARRQLWKHLQRSNAAGALDEENAAELEFSGDGPAELLLRSEAVAAVRAGMDELPAALREVVILCSLEEMSYEQAAQVLSVPVGTVRSRLHRAKARLAGLLRGEVAGMRRKPRGRRIGNWMKSWRRLGASIGRLTPRKRWRRHCALRLVAEMIRSGRKS
jgi:RNA polymerase sigma-70 factor (ECF subfamily)